MAEVKWVKLTTDMFDNRKVKHLRRLPEGNNIVLIWVMLLTMAGRCNSGGMIFLTENIPYTPKMLADELDFEENTVILALQVLEQLDMIVTNNGFFSIAGWEEYQNIEGMDKIREQNRLRKQKQRENQKLLEDVSRDSHVTVTVCHATDIEEDKDKEGDIHILNSVPEGASDESKKPLKPSKHKHGEFHHVLLTDDELAHLECEYGFDVTRQAITFLDEYIEEKGYKSKSHYLAIRRWVIEAVSDRKAPKVTKPEQKNEYNDFMAKLAAMRQGE
jgi:predicted phage replisome organizer